jgi:hypothetical protein
MLDRSVGAAAALGTVQLLTGQISRGNGATVDVRVVRKQVRPSGISAGTVTFEGVIEYRVVVTSGGKHISTLDRISGPIEIVKSPTGWQVSDVSFAGAPMRYYYEAITRTVRGARLTVAFVLSTAEGTSVPVGLHSPESGETLYLQRLSLVLPSGRSVAGRALFAHGMGAGLLAFPRIDQRPVRLIADFRRSDGTDVDFSVPLPGAAS